MTRMAGAKGRVDRRKAAAYFHKLTAAARSEEPPAFDRGRGAPSIIEHAFDDGGADADPGTPDAPGGLFVAAPGPQ